MSKEDRTAPTPVFGEVCVRKQRRKRQKKLLTQLFLDFSQNTTFHGLRYVAESGLHLVERVFWLVTFAVSVGCSFYYIYCVWCKWSDSPVIVSFDGKHVSVESVPFPSVTICPQTKFRQSHFNYTKLIDKRESTEHNETDLEISNALSMVCDHHWATQHINITNADSVQHIINYSLSRRDVIISCQMASGKRCDNLFTKILTKEGVCYNMNGLPAEEMFKTENIQDQYQYTFTNQSVINWSIAEGYREKNDRKSYPMPGRDNGGGISDIQMILNIHDAHRDSTCSGLYSGYKIYFHHPADYPQTSISYAAALPNMLSSIALRFTMITTSNSLRSYPLDVRQCYFSDERPLKYFRYYTFINCRTECLSNYTYNLCSCVPFYLPHSNSSEICAVKSWDCVRRAEEAQAKRKLKVKLCACLPACNSIQYDADINKTYKDMKKYYQSSIRRWPFHFRKSKILMKLFESAVNKTYAPVDLYFKQPMFMSVQRTELFGKVDFLGTCGGLLGLFLGFSFLSIVEIFYFLTFRVYRTISTDLKKEKKEKKRKLTK